MHLQLTSSAGLFEHHRIPLLYVYSDSDQTDSSQLNAEFAQMFGVDTNSTDIYDSECRPTYLCQKTGPAAFRLCVVFACSFR